MMECTDGVEMKQEHKFIISSIIIDEQSVQIIDNHGVIRTATRINNQFSFNVYRDSAYSDILRIEDCDQNTATFSTTRIHVDIDRKTTFKTTKYYARRRFIQPTIASKTHESMNKNEGREHM